ncbi:DNA endonuclease SmrA [Edwardsiella hoshinae]|nr:DNA endonuclease SmrA [Edwardsiella hoshinae]
MESESLFHQEMIGVKPLVSDRVRFAAQSAPSAAQLARRAAAQQVLVARPDYLSLEAVEMLSPHDLVGFKREGIQEGVYRKLRLGKYALQAVLDLHRHTLSEARSALLQFIADCVLVLHGKGERSQPQALLKSYVSAWLPQIPEVMALHSAERRHGGSGALYVLLRKSERRKADNRERHQKRLG